MQDYINNFNYLYWCLLSQELGITDYDRIFFCYIILFK